MGTTHINKTHILMESLTLPHFNGVLDSIQLMDSLTLPNFKGVLDSTNKVEILIPSNSNMPNFLGIPNFLIKIGLNNLQNKMNIKKLI